MIFYYKNPIYSHSTSPFIYFLITTLKFWFRYYFCPIDINTQVEYSTCVFTY